MGNRSVAGFARGVTSGQALFKPMKRDKAVIWTMVMVSVVSTAWLVFLGWAIYKIVTWLIAQ